MQRITTPVCIIGGGPAGATASLYLSRFGIEHVIVDRARFPRDKVCGECFDGRVERILTDLLPEARRELRVAGHFLESRRYDVWIRGGRLPIRLAENARAKWIVPRSGLDAYLLDQAGQSPYARLLTGQAIQRVEPTADGVRLEGPGVTIATEMLLRAEGAQGALAAGIRKGGREDYLLAARQYHEGVRGVDGQTVSFYFFRRPAPGCLVVAPLADGRWLVEIGITKQDFQRGGMTFTQLLAAYLAADPELRSRFADARPLEKMKGTFMPIDLRIRDGIATDRQLLLGAAAFSAHPVTGMGVGNALVTGQLAALTVRDCLAERDFSSRRTVAYERALRRRLRSVVRFNRLAYLLTRNLRWVEWPLAVTLRSTPARWLFRRTDAVDYLFRFPGVNQARKLLSPLRGLLDK